MGGERRRVRRWGRWERGEGNIVRSREFGKSEGVE